MESVLISNAIRHRSKKYTLAASPALTLILHVRSGLALGRRLELPDPALLWLPVLSLPSEALPQNRSSLNL